MKKMIFLIIFTTNFINTYAQLFDCSGFSISSNCRMYTIVDDCSGEELTIDGSVSVCCENRYGIYKTKYYPVNRGILYLTDFGKECKPKICLNSRNWEICEISGCTIKVYQTVTVKPSFNGGIIADGETYSGSDAYAPCIGGIYSEAINSVSSPAQLKLCNGDPVILNLNGLSIPENSGLCLTVSIKELNGDVVSSHTYTGDDIDGANVDISGLLDDDDLSFVTTYILEYSLHCCDGLSTCDVNSTISLYIEIVGEFSFSPWVNYGFYPNASSTIPPSSTPSLDISSGAVNLGGININQITFIGYNVENPNNEDLSWSLTRNDCFGGGVVNQYSGSISDVGNPFTIGALLLQTPAVEDCFCYELVLTYDNGCEDDAIVESYYFKQGLCGPDQLIGDNDGEQSYKVKTMLNGNNLELDLSGFESDLPEQLDIRIFNTNGQLIEQVVGDVSVKRINAQVDLSSGIYFYSFSLEGKVYAGRIIKL